jgi:hypothetical protein
VLDDVISFNGALSGKTQWQYSKDGAETASNPSTLGAALNQTFARVDKVNKQIDIVASQTEANAEEIGAIKLTTEQVALSVEKTTNDIDSINDNISNLTKKANLAVTADAVQIAIDSTIANGVEKVITSTGYTFNDTGLKISKSGSELSTVISDDGMTVSKSGREMLTANNQGVEAVNLNASTFLIIGGKSRFESYNSNRTACFWIGG